MAGKTGSAAVVRRDASPVSAAAAIVYEDDRKVAFDKADSRRVEGAMKANDHNLINQISFFRGKIGKRYRCC
jgi:hypothetical protein